VALLFVVLVALFGVGLWGAHRAAFPGKGLYRVEGVFQARWGDTMILVGHQAVPGIMDEMGTMSFFAESKELLDRADLKPGDKVRFTIRQIPDKLLVTEIQKYK
jgi:hypothetical protein